jgi:hypothetical protein
LKEEPTQNSFIEDEKVIKKILKHPELGEVKKRPPLKLKSSPSNPVTT